jgi:predicted phosphodiesterase
VSRVLVIGDVHEPVAHPGYLRFCKDLYRRHKCDTVVFIGDLIDWHSISFHKKHPGAPAQMDEYKAAKKRVARWRRAFPKAYVCIGNHDERIFRLAADAGIPGDFIKSYEDVWGEKLRKGQRRRRANWKWVNEVIIDDVYYTHGTGNAGVHPAFNLMGKMLMSSVMGHIHSAGGIKWRANPRKRIFGMDTGCGVDEKALAFAYGVHSKVRSILSAGVVLRGTPHHEIMAIGPGERYHRSRFARGKR